MTAFFKQSALLEHGVNISVKIEIYSVTEHSYGINLDCMPMCDCEFCKNISLQQGIKTSDIIEVYSVAVYCNGIILN